MHEMIKLRAKLEELNIGWIDSSDDLFIRTHFWYNNNFVSVVNGEGSYGGKKGLLECWILSEDPIVYMTADDVIKYITDKLN